MIVGLEKEGDSIAAVLGDLYSLAIDEDGDFSYKKKLIEAVKKVKKRDVILEARKIFLDPNTPRLEVLMRAKGSKVKIPAGVIDDVKRFKEQIIVQERNS